jgi:hypothetical protein
MRGYCQVLLPGHTQERHPCAVSGLRLHGWVVKSPYRGFIMMYVFLANNRHELIERCRAKVAQRPAREATAQQLQNGVPMFLDQLIRTLQTEQTSQPMDSRRISGPSGGGASL